MSHSSSRNGDASTAGKRPAPRRNSGWVWYLVVLFVLTVAAITTLVTFNLRQQLRPEQLAAAKALWKEKGPRDYDLEYTKQVQQTELFRSRVRDGKVVAATRNGQPLEERLYRYSSVPGLFSDIERFLEIDAEPGRPRTFTVASFNGQDGHPLRYVRRVMGSTERVEITVKLTPVAGGKTD